MALTESQIKSVWLAQQRINSLRYNFMNQSEKAAFDTELETVYLEVKPYLLQRYAQHSVDLGVVEDFVDNSTDPLYPISGTTTIDGVIVSSQLEKHVTNITDDSGKILLWNLNFVNISGNTNPTDPESLLTNVLEEVWVFQYDPHSPEIPNPTIVAGEKNVIANDIVFKRFLHDMNTWNPDTPDQFAVNEYFKDATQDPIIIWINKYDPTQRFKWINIIKNDFANVSGTLEAINKLPLDQGLDQGIYDPAHPEDIDTSWALESSGAGVWVWKFEYDDDTYRLQITQQVDGTYKHAVLFKKLSNEDYYKFYIGDTF